MKNKKKLFIGVVAIVVILFLSTLLSNSGNMLTGKLDYKIRKKNKDQTKLPSLGEVAVVKYPGCRKVQVYGESVDYEDGRTGVNFDGIVDITVNDFVEEVMLDGSIFQLIIGAFLDSEDSIEMVEILPSDLADSQDYRFSTYIEESETTFNSISFLSLTFPFIDVEVLLTMNDGRLFKLSGPFLTDVRIQLHYNSDVRGDFEFKQADHLNMQNVFAGKAKVNFALIDAELSEIRMTLDGGNYQLVRIMENGSEQEVNDQLIENSIAALFNLYGDANYNFFQAIQSDSLSELNILLANYLEDSKMDEMAAIIFARRLLLDAGSFSDVELVFSERIEGHPTGQFTYSYFCDRGKTKQTMHNPFLITPTYKYVKNWIDYNF